MHLEIRRLQHFPPDNCLGGHEFQANNLLNYVNGDHQGDNSRLENKSNSDGHNKVTESSRPALLRRLGLLEGTTIVAGTMIGSGIFAVAGQIAAGLGNFVLIIAAWFLGGLLSLLGGCVYAELGAMLPRTGGPYVFLREAYGNRAAFLWSWMEFWVGRTGGMAAVAIIFAHYALLAVGENNPSLLSTKSIGIGSILILAVLNIRGVRQGGNVQNIFTFLKTGALVALIGAAFGISRGHISNFRTVVPAGIEGPMLTAFGLAVIATLWAYSGWENVTTVAEELRVPERTIPRALFIGIGIVTILYVTTNVAYHFVLPMNGVAAAGEDIAAVVGEQLFGKAGRTVIALAVACSTFGVVNASMLSAPRIYFAAARDTLALKPMGRIHAKYCTPALAISAQAIWASFLVLVAGFTDLVIYVMVMATAFSGLTVASVLVLRRKMPDRPRPYRTLGYPIVPILYLVIVTALLTSVLIERPLHSLLGLGIVALGVPAYFWLNRRSE